MAIFHSKMLVHQRVSISHNFILTLLYLAIAPKPKRSRSSQEAQPDARDRSLPYRIPSGELTCCYGKSPFLMGKSTISMAIFHCYVSSPEGTPGDVHGCSSPHS